MLYHLNISLSFKTKPTLCIFSLLKGNFRKQKMDVLLGLAILTALN